MTIEEIRNDLIELGLGDNIDLALLLYLAMTMRKTSSKLSVLVTGPAGVGKSYLSNTIIGLMPYDDVIQVSKMTPAALVRQGDLSHKILSVYETYKDEQFAQYIRELISEGEVVYTTANDEHRLQGPTTLIETTANIRLVGIENRSRYFVAHINATKETREHILALQRASRTNEGVQEKGKKEGIIKKHRNYQEQLETNLGVMLPYATRIRFLSASPHAPRIQQRVLNLIEAVTFLQQHHREIVEHDNARYVLSTEEDFECARGILKHIKLDEDESILPQDTMEFWSILQSNHEKLSQGDLTRQRVWKLIKKSDFPYSSYKVVEKHMTILAKTGFLEAKGVRGSKNKYIYEFNQDMMLDSEIHNNCYSSLCLC